MGIFNKTSELMKKYEIEKGSLGSGNFAVVKKCWAKGTAKEGPYYAVKIIDKSKVEDMGDIEREIEIMGMVQHQNVIKLVEIFDEPKKMNLVMELVTGGELFDRIVSLGNYTEKDAAVVMSTLCNALDYLHAKGIVHRDLKPNILLENDSKDAAIKVADFGLARMISGKDMMKTACGTPGYVAPEVLQNKGYSSERLTCGPPASSSTSCSAASARGGAACALRPDPQGQVRATSSSNGLRATRSLPNFRGEPSSDAPQKLVGDSIWQRPSLDPMAPPHFADGHPCCTLRRPSCPPHFRSTPLLWHSPGRYDFPSPWWDNISTSAKDLVRKLLTVDPKKRATAKDVLAHP